MMRIRPVTSLRLASVLTFLHAVLHTIGGVLGKPAPGPAQTAVAAMQANHFLVLGATRTYWDFQMGLGWGITIFLTVEAVVFWQLGTLSRVDSYRLRPIYAAFLVGYVAFAVDSYRYFFAPPVIVELLIALCFAAAFASSRQPEEQTF